MFPSADDPSLPQASQDRTLPMRRPGFPNVYGQWTSARRTLESYEFWTPPGITQQALAAALGSPPGRLVWP